jgi:hypothetical protein
LAAPYDVETFDFNWVAKWDSSLLGFDASWLEGKSVADKDMVGSFSLVREGFTIVYYDVELVSATSSVREDGKLELSHE